MPGAAAGEGLRDQLDRWVAAGLIDPAQAARIEAAESARTGEPGPAASREAGGAEPAGTPAAPAPAAPVGGAPPGRTPAAGRRRRMPLAAEALGYVGGVLAVVAGIVAVGQLWHNIPVSAELAFAAVAAAALWIGGLALHTDRDPAFARLRSALWLMSTAALAAFVGLLGGQVIHLRPLDVAITVAAVGTGYAVVLWLPGRAPLQHLVMFAGAAALTAAVVNRVGPGLSEWVPGLGVWVLSAGWAVAAYRGYLPPRLIGCLASGIGLLASAQVTMTAWPGYVFALATVAALLVAGVVLHRVEWLVIGAVGILQTVPQTASRYLPSSVGAPVAIFVVGLVLLTVAVLIARGRRPRPGASR